MNNLKGIIDVLGENNAEELQKRLVDVIVEKAQQDLNDYSEYLFYPPDIRDCIGEAFDSVEKKVVKMYKDAIIDVNKDYISKMKKYMSDQVKESTLRSEVLMLAQIYYWKGNQYSKERKFAEELLKILRITQEEFISECEGNDNQHKEVI